MLSDQWIGPVGDISLQLRLELINLVAQVSNDVLVGADVLRDHLFVRLDTHFDILGAIGVLERVDCLFILC